VVIVVAATGFRTSINQPINQSINQSIIYLLITHQAMKQFQFEHKTSQAGQPGTRCTYGCPILLCRFRLSHWDWSISGRSDWRSM